MKKTAHYLGIICLLLFSTGTLFAQLPISEDSDQDGIHNDIDLSEWDKTIFGDIDNPVYGYIDSAFFQQNYPTESLPISGLTITNLSDPDPKNSGVLVDNKSNFNIRIVYFCGGALKTAFVASGQSKGNIACGSSDITVLSGSFLVTFTGSDGSESTVDMPAGNSLKFIPETNTLDAPVTNANTLTVTMTTEGTTTEITIPPGSVESINPDIQEITLPVDPWQLNTTTPVSVSATYLDPDNKNYTAVWDWGDGTSSPGTISNPSSGLFEVAGSHFYTSPGVYTVSLTLTDADGGSRTKSSTGDKDETTSYIVVYDPSGGFVTGGGWIDSPEGAYVPEPLLSGKASFGFVSKYQKGKSIPSGQTEFQFKAGDLNFQSSAYDWLVINKHKAMFKGSGTINRAGNYGFQLSAIDEALTPSTDDDLFRIMIWDKDNDDAQVYDNQIVGSPNADPTTIIGGGNITIQNNANKSGNLSIGTFSNGRLVKGMRLNAFPNPFKNSINIQFQSAENGRSRLSILDLFGREIRVLDQQRNISGGLQEINWDGRDRDGQQLPAGIYQVKFQLNEHILFQPVVLVK